MSQGPPPQLKAFLKNANVQVKRAPAPPLANFNFDKFIEDTMREEPTGLKYANFIAEVGPVSRPDVLDFVRRTKPLRKDGPYDVQEISGYYGQFQKGITHTNLYGVQLHQNLESNNQPWTFIEFRVAVKQKKMIICRLYKDKMMVQGGCVDNDPATGLKVARYIAMKYLKQNSADMRMKFASLDGGFKVSGGVRLPALSAALVKDKVEHSYEPELSSTELTNVRYEGVVIDGITHRGIINLRNKKSVAELKKTYEVAKKFMQKYEAVVNSANGFAPNVVENNLPEPKKVRVPKVLKLRNKANVLLNDMMCSKYKTEELKQICKAMGIFTKKTWKKKDMCQAIFDKTADNYLEGKVEKKARPNTLYKNRGINDTSIKKMLNNAYGTNFNKGRNIINADLKKVKNGMNKVKTNKKGVPFKGEVEKLARDVARARKMQVLLQKYNAGVRDRVRAKVADAKVLTNKSVERVAKQIISRDKKLKKILGTKNFNAVKNKNFKKNVKPEVYAKQYKLVLEYIRVVVRPRVQSVVRREMLNWLNARNTNPSDDTLKRALVSFIRRGDDPYMNLPTMEKLYAARRKKSS